MALRTWQAGIVSQNAAADKMVTGPEVISARRVFWVDPNSPNALDDLGHAGLPECPFATMAYTETRIAADDIVICASGFTETLDATLQLGNRATWVGIGLGENKPTLRMNALLGGTTLVSIEQVGVEFIGFRLRGVQTNADATQLTSLLHLVSGSAASLVRDCDLTFEATGTPPTGLLIGTVAVGTAHYTTIEGCTFTNETDTSHAASIEPASAISFGYLGPNDLLRLTGCTFDGGDKGWGLAALYVNSSVDLQYYTIADNTFKNASSIQLLGGHLGVMSNNTLDPSCNIELANASRVYPDGLVSEADGGNQILWGPDFRTSGSVYYVDICNPRASDSNLGTDREHPFASISHAIASATTADLILVEGGVNAVYPISASLVIAAPALRIYGLGAESTKPRILLTTPTGSTVVSVALGSNITNALGAEFHGFTFPASETLSTGFGVHVGVVSLGVVVEGCDFELGLYNGIGLTTDTNATNFTVTNNRFTVSADNSSSRLAIQMNTAPETIRRSTLTNNVFDGGLYGFTAAIQCATGSGLERLLIESNEFLGRASVQVPTNNTKLLLSGNEGVPTVRVKWA